MPRSATAISNRVPLGVVEIAPARHRMSLPPAGSRRPENPGAGADEGLTSDTGRPLRILIVDDEPSVAVVLEDMVTEAGGESVGVITSALAAIGAAAVISPDVVLMDVRLPGAMDGIEAAGIIRARRSAAVVIITGAASDPEIRARLSTQGEFEIVSKPILENELYAAIRRAYAAR